MGTAVSMGAAPVDVRCLVLVLKGFTERNYIKINFNNVCFVPRLIEPFTMCGFVSSECRDVLLPMMLRELSGALASMADGPHDERRNSLELLNNILEVLSRGNVVRWQILVVKNT